MAFAAPNVTSTRDTTNYLRLCRLLVDVGSQALRDTFDSIHSPRILHKVLSANRPTLQSLKNKRVINEVQWGKLFPSTPTTVSSRDFDMTLLTILLRNVCGLVPPSTGWDNLPVVTDHSLEADIARIKHFRNAVYAHAERASVDDATFSTYWRDIRDTLIRLGGSTYEAAVDSLKDECMDPEMQKHYTALFIQWKKDEDNMKEQLNEIMRKLDALAAHKETTDQKGEDKFEKEKASQPAMCKEKYHNNETLQYYCVDCEVCICLKCGQTRHNHHQKVDVQQAAEEVKMQRQKFLEKAESQVLVFEAKIKEQGRLISISEQEIIDAQNKVTISVENFVQRLWEHEAKTRQKLKDIHETQQREHQKRLAELQSHVSYLKSAIEHDKSILQHSGGVEILEIGDETYSVQEEELNGRKVEIYRPGHVDYVWKDCTENKSVKVSSRLLEDRIIVSHTDVSQSTVDGRGLREADVNVRTGFKITTRDSEGRQVYNEEDQVAVTIIDPQGGEESEDGVRDCKDGTYIVQFLARSAGLHHLRIEVNGRPLSASPWRVQVTPHRYKDATPYCGEGPSAFVFPWSVAVNERTGQIAVAGYSSKRIQIFDKQWKYQKTVGGGGSQRGPRVQNALDIGHPISVAFLRNDDLVFSREEIAHKEQMSVFTAHGQFINRFSDHLVRPLSVFVKPEGKGHVIVSDVGDRTIKVLSPDGKDLLQEFSPPDCHETAEFVFYHNSMFFASYQREDCVKVFNDDGIFLYDIGNSGSDDQNLLNPVGLAVDKFNQLIICDTGNYRVQVYTLDGDFLYSITDEIAIIESPWFVTASSNGDVLITDVAVALHRIYFLK